MDVSASLAGGGIFGGRKILVMDPARSSQLSNVVTVSAAAAAGPDGFSAVYRAHFGFVVNSLRRLGIPSADLEDITHDVFITAFRRHATYDQERPIRPWLFGIAFRLAADFRQLVRHTRELPFPGTMQLVDEGNAPDESAALRQDRQVVLDGLAKVELTRRAVLIMHDIDDLPVPEIASTLEIPLGTAYSRLRQARIDFSEAVRTLRAPGDR